MSYAVGCFGSCFSKFMQTVKPGWCCSVCLCSPFVICRSHSDSLILFCWAAFDSQVRVGVFLFFSFTQLLLGKLCLLCMLDTSLSWKKERGEGWGILSRKKWYCQVTCYGNDCVVQIHTSPEEQWDSQCQQPAHLQEASSGSLVSWWFVCCNVTGVVSGKTVLTVSGCFRWLLGCALLQTLFTVNVGGVRQCAACHSWIPVVGVFILSCLVSLLRREREREREKWTDLAGVNAGELTWVIRLGFIHENSMWLPLWLD